MNKRKRLEFSKKYINVETDFQNNRGYTNMILMLGACADDAS